MILLCLLLVLVAWLIDGPRGIVIFLGSYALAWTFCQLAWGDDET